MIKQDFALPFVPYLHKLYLQNLVHSFVSFEEIALIVFS